MKVVFRNPVPAVEAILKYYKCENCKSEFRWTDECLSRVVIEDKYNDRTECLCSKCSQLYLNNQLKLTFMPIDYSTYPANWKSEIRPRILKRARNKCECCGVENGRLIHRFGKEIHEFEYVPEGMQSEVYHLEKKKVIKIVLTIAHLDHDEENHNVKDDRLKAMCQQCHLRYDSSEKVRRKKQKSNPNQLNLL